MTARASQHFLWSELQCRGRCTLACGGRRARFVSDAALVKLEALRTAMGVGFTPSSAARCPRHNALVGGAPLSQHRSTFERPSTAFDIPLVIPKPQIIALAETAGFRGIGVSYRTFVHVDDRPNKARW